MDLWELLRNGWLKWLIIAAVLLSALAWTAAVGVLWQRQEAMLFYPEPLPADHRFDLPATREVNIPVPGGTLHGLHYRHADEGRPTRGLVFFLHGNAGNVVGWLPSVDFWRRTGMDLFMLDYRGYGKSTGRIASEAQLHDDVRRAWEAVAPGYQGLPRVVYGRSLGSGLAARLAADLAGDAAQPHLLVLVSPYESMQRLVGELYPWVPSWALRYPLRTDEALAQVRSPVLLVHGAQDDLIPADHARRLHARKPGSELLVLPDAGHNDVQLSSAYTDTLAARLQALR